MHDVDSTEPVAVPGRVVQLFRQGNPARAIVSWLQRLDPPLLQGDLGGLGIKPTTLSAKMGGVNPWRDEELVKVFRYLAKQTIHPDHRKGAEKHPLQQLLEWCGESRSGKRRFPQSAAARKRKLAKSLPDDTPKGHVKIRRETTRIFSEDEHLQMGEALEAIMSTLRGRVSSEGRQRLVEEIMKKWSQARFGSDKPPEPRNVRPFPKGTELLCTLCDQDIEPTCKRTCPNCGLFCPAWTPEVPEDS